MRPKFNGIPDLIAATSTMCNACVQYMHTVVVCIDVEGYQHTLHNRSMRCRYTQYTPIWKHVVICNTHRYGNMSLYAIHTGMEASEEHNATLLTSNPFRKITTNTYILSAAGRGQLTTKGREASVSFKIGTFDFQLQKLTSAMK